MSNQLSDLERFKLKKLIQDLQSVKGDGTTLVSIAVKAGADVSGTIRMIKDEIGTASNIKSSQTSKDVVEALQSALGVVKNYTTKALKNGLLIFAGNGINQQTGKQKRYNIGYEPPLPVPSPLYRCQSYFKTEMLEEMLQDKRTFGFIIIDRSSAYFGLLNGNQTQKLESLSTDIPKKHKKGGQSQARISRQRQEKITAHLYKVGEKARLHFLKNNETEYLIEGLFIAGVGDLKNHLNDDRYLGKKLISQLLDQPVEVSYGGEQGFKSAINQVANTINSVRYIKEKKILEKFFGFISQNQAEQICYGYKPVESAVKMGMVKDLLVWEDSEIRRFVIQTNEQEEQIVYSYQGQELPKEFKILEEDNLVDWLIDQVQDCQTTEIHFISDQTPEGFQFCQGFGGVGGILFHSMDFDPLEIEENAVEDDEDFI